MPALPPAPPQTIPKYIGPSSDGRTNKWRVTCPLCQAQFEPVTTIKRFQILECPTCHADLSADWNAPNVQPLTATASQNPAA